MSTRGTLECAQNAHPRRLTPNTRRSRGAFCERLAVAPVLRYRCSPEGTRVDWLIPGLYLHGLAEGNADLAPRGLLGEDARLSLSASTVSRLKIS